VRFLNSVDYGVIGLYCLVIVAMGLYLQRRASQNLESYFLGGRKLPWWALGISGMLNYLDMSGTMVIVSLLYMLGPRGFFIEFRGGACLVLAFMMCWTGKWYRRSNCMTGAEWQVYRFGMGPDAKAARLISSISGICFTFGLLAYLIVGAMKFLPMFVPLSPFYCALIMVGLTTLYTVLAGFLGVVYTDILQAFIIVVSIVIISVMAALQIQQSPAPLSEVATQVTQIKDWMSSLPTLVAEMPKGYENYSLFMLVIGFYFFRNVLNGMGTGADQKYLSARNERECGLLTFFWIWMMSLRWPMMMGFAVLGLFLVHDIFPDQKAIAETEMAIKTHYAAQANPGYEFDLHKAARVAAAVPRAQWNKILNDANTPKGVDAETASKLAAELGPEWQAELAGLVEQDERIAQAVPEKNWEFILAQLIQKPDEHPALRDRIRELLGEKWDEKLSLVGYRGTISSERVLPAVILMEVPRGLRGLFVVALVAAAMSTFAPMVNGAVATFTRDIYQAFLRKNAKNFELMTASYLFGMVVVAGGFGMAYRSTTINEIWDWLMMGLGTATFVPQILRMYWWRFNGTGVVVGTACGICFAFADRILTQAGVFDAITRAYPWFHWAPMWEFGVLLTLCTLACVVGSYLAPPTKREVLEHFYKTTRPFGFWKPLRGVLDPEQARATRREHFYDVISVPFALLWQITLFLIPMQMIIGNWRECAVTAVLCVVGLVGLLIFWYRHLPPARDGVEHGGDLALIRSFYEQPASSPVPEPVRAS